MHVSDLEVRFVQMPEYGNGDPKPLCAIQMQPPELPRQGDFVFLPGEGLREWLVRRVQVDLRNPRQREVAVWVSAA